MATNTKDNLQAHRFMNRRVRAALLEGDAESNTRPLARLGTGTYAGIFVTIALLAVFGIIGVLKPGGSTAWQEPGAFIVEEETGARYVYLDGVLHPVLNYSSAKLLLGDRLHVVTVSVRSLESAPHGADIGIPMAPDSLPDAAHIVGTDWSVCAIGNAADGEPVADRDVPRAGRRRRPDRDRGRLPGADHQRTDLPDLVRPCLRDRRAVARSVEVPGRRGAAGR